MACESKAGIFSSETQEDIKILGLVGERGSWGFIAGYKSHRDLGADGWEDLKGGGEMRKKDVDEMGFGIDKGVSEISWGKSIRK